MSETTMRRICSVALAVALLTAGLIAVPGLAGQHQDRDGQDRSEDKRPDRAMGPEDRRQWAQERRQEALERAEQRGLFGSLSYEDGQLSGSFIEAELDADTGTLSAYTLIRNGSHTVLDTIEFDADPDGNVTTRPATASVFFPDGELRVHDNPTAQFVYRSTTPANVTIDIADGYNVTVDDDATKARLAGDVNATVLVGDDGDVSAQDGTIEASIDESGTVLFHARPDQPGEQASQRALEHAAEQGKLGGEIRVSGSGGVPVDQSTPVDVEMRAQHAQDGQAIVEVDGEAEDGRVVNLKINKDNLPVDAPEEVVPKLDREEIPRESSIDDVVNATGDQPAAHVDVGADVVEVTIWVPEFSLHSVNVQDATQDVSDLPDPIASTNPTGASIGLAEQTKQRALSQAQDWSQLGADAQTEATANGQQAGLFGQANLEEATGTLQGAHVQASVDAQAGVLEDVRLTDRDSPATVFEQVRPTSFTPAEDAQELGPAIALPGEEVAVLAHDQPTGLVELKADDEATQVELDVASDAEIDRVDDRHLEITTPTGLTVHLAVVAGAADLVVEGDTIVANLGANAAVQALADPGETVPADAHLEQRLEAAKQGQLGAEAAITATEDGKPVEDRAETSVELEVTEVDQAEGSVTVNAASQVPDPRAVTLNLDPQLVDEVPADEIGVLVDGEPIPEAEAQAVLDTDRSQASFHAEGAGDGLQVLVQLDGFSEHDVTVQSNDTTDDGSTDDGTDDGSTDDSTDDGSADGGQTDDTPSLSVGAVLATVGLIALLRRR
jgi:hypothetical protein